MQKLNSNLNEVKNTTGGQGGSRVRLYIVLAVAGIVLFVGGGLFLLSRLPELDFSKTVYQNYAGLEELAKDNPLPGSKVSLPVTVSQAAFTKADDGGKAYNIYRWKLGEQMVEARFSSKLKQLPDGNITISGVVQSNLNQVLVVFVDKINNSSAR